jgi:hypothetical protein
MRKHRGYWTLDVCKKIALKYDNKRDFRLYDNNAYSASKCHNYLNNICSHMKSLNNAHYRCIYAYEFSQTNSVYVGLTYSMELRQVKRRNKSCDTVTMYINQTGYSSEYKQLTDYVEVERAIKLEEEYVNKYKNDGWNILNRAKTGSIGWTGRKHRYDDLDYVKSIICEYKSVGDLIKRNEALYLKIRDNGWKDILYPMLNYKKRYPSSFWNKENLIEFAKKFKCTKDFKKEFVCAYNIACKNNWMNEIRQYMKVTNL